MARYTVDRIEDGIAVCEDEKDNLVKIETSLLPDGVREGDILEASDEGFVILREETGNRRKKMAELQRSIFTKKKS